jgi:hypothetical protein
MLALRWGSLLEEHSLSDDAQLVTMRNLQKSIKNENCRLMLMTSRARKKEVTW